MYHKIMVPVDLAHADKLHKAITTAIDLAARYGASLLFVGVTTEAPSEVAHTPSEYARKLEDFAAARTAGLGLDCTAKAYASHDPSADLNEALINAAHENGADAIVMASHVPGLPEHVFASHAGAVAAHADISVFVVR